SLCQFWTHRLKNLAKMSWKLRDKTFLRAGNTEFLTIMKQLFRFTTTDTSNLIRSFHKKLKHMISTSSTALILRRVILLFGERPIVGWKIIYAGRSYFRLILKVGL